MKRFTGKTVIVTGAASGIGRASAMELTGVTCYLSSIYLIGRGLNGTPPKHRFFRP
jgi:NADP-dependent 3-hydroxy acid dehydrogenase YdfG